MNRIRFIKWIFVLLFIALTALSGLAQAAKEPYQQAAERAALTMRQGNFDAAIQYYTEAINHFPKIDAFTPQNKKIKLADGKFTETPYIGLDGFYLARAKAQLHKRDFKEAENDYVNALTVLKYEITKNLSKAKNHRTNVDIKKEKKNGYVSVWNSDLVRAAFSYSAALQSCEKAKYSNNRRRRDYADLRIQLSPSEQNISGFGEIIKHQENALFGKAEAYATSMIEIENKGHSFWALKSSDELIAAFPNNIEAYQLRAKVNRYWGRDAAALADEQKAKELSGQK